MQFVCRWKEKHSEKGQRLLSTEGGIHSLLSNRRDRGEPKLMLLTADRKEHSVLSMEGKVELSMNQCCL